MQRQATKAAVALQTPRLTEPAVCVSMDKMTKEQQKQAKPKSEILTNSLIAADSRHVKDTADGRMLHGMMLKKSLEVTRWSMRTKLKKSNQQTCVWRKKNYTHAIFQAE